MSKTIAFISGKGGVGKTTLAVNIAASLHELGEDTLLVDANLTNPHVGIMLGNYSTGATIHDVLTEHLSAMQSVHHHPTGLKIVPGSINPRHEGGMNLEILGQYASMAKHVLMDSPPANHSHVLACANEAIVVTTTDHVALLDARRSIEQAEENGVHVTGVIVNKHEGSNATKQESIERFLGYPVLAMIAENKKFLEAAELQIPYTWLNPKSKSTKVLKDVAMRIVGIPHEKI